MARKGDIRCDFLNSLHSEPPTDDALQPRPEGYGVSSCHLGSRVLSSNLRLEFEMDNQPEPRLGAGGPLAARSSCLRCFGGA